jgi:hypothetical protein
LLCGPGRPVLTFYATEVWIEGDAVACRFNWIARQSEFFTRPAKHLSLGKEAACQPTAVIDAPAIHIYLSLLHS